MLPIWKKTRNILCNTCYAMIYHHYLLRIYILHSQTVTVCSVLYVCHHMCTWSKHRLSHEQVIQRADIVPARQENQDCSFLSDKTKMQNLTADKQSYKYQQGQKKKTSISWSHKWAKLTGCQRSLRTRAEADLARELPTSTFSSTKDQYPRPTSSSWHFTNGRQALRSHYHRDRLDSLNSVK